MYLVEGKWIEDNRIVPSEEKCSNCGHPWIDHSCNTIGPCFWNRVEQRGKMPLKDQMKAIGKVKNNECDCPYFDSDPFVEEVARMRGEK